MHWSLTGQGMQSRAAKATTVLATLSWTTSFQVVLVFPAGQMACLLFQSMVKSCAAKPCCALAWREVSSRTGVTKAML